MPRLFRPKLSCFYCGCRSAQIHSSNIRQWQCEKCDAINYLDEVLFGLHSTLVLTDRIYGRTEKSLIHHHWILFPKLDMLDPFHAQLLQNFCPATKLYSAPHAFKTKDS